MANLEGAIEAIKHLECPTGDVEKRVMEILQKHGQSVGMVKRDERLDTSRAQAYCTQLSNEGEALVVLAKSGMDDYVATVVDAYVTSHH